MPLAGVQMMQRAVYPRHATGCQGPEFPTNWQQGETPPRPAGKLPMRGPKRPIMCVRTHPRAPLLGRKWRRNPSGWAASVTGWERPARWPYTVEE